MKAVIFERYGSAEVLDVMEVPAPRPGDDEVLVSVCAASINPLDWHFMTGLPYLVRLQMGLLKPRLKRIGADVSGRVEAVGKNVVRFAPGDEVFGGYAGETPAHPAISLGTCAERICVPEDALVHKPASLSFEQAAGVSVAAQTALQGLRDVGRIESGQQVLINGASGGVGTFAVQLARSFGAHVTGVCSGRNEERVRSIGADRVIDYTEESFTVGDTRYDLVFDLIGNHPLREVRRVLKRGATYVSCFGQPEHRWLGPGAMLLQMQVLGRFVRERLVTWVTRMDPSDLEILRKMFEEGSLTTVIDEVYPIDDIRAAMTKLESGHARGKIIIAV